MDDDLRHSIRDSFAASGAFDGRRARGPNQIKAGDVAKVTSLLSKGVSFNRGGTFEYRGYTRKNVTPLMLAAETGHMDVVRTLFKALADIHLSEPPTDP